MLYALKIKCHLEINFWSSLALNLKGGIRTIKKKYNIIYADPPWKYERSKVQGAAENHYPTMSIEELCTLPVSEIAEKDCVLFLWATFP